MSKCVLCENRLDNGIDLAMILSFQKVIQKLICQICEADLVQLPNQPHCLKCGRASPNLECQDCQKWNDDLVNQALFSYNDPMKAYFKRYKFQGDYWLRMAFKDQFVNFIQKLVKEDELIVLIPVDDSTMNSRGFNQVAGLTEGLANQDILENQRNELTKHQSQRTRKERLQHANSFQIKPNRSIVGTSIVLIDDIYTTGATLRQAAQVLKQQGALKVRSITLCR
jgi:competence protein ComFC